jgi:ATP-dependent HslUV protease ATP-binding subunit HslU
VKEPAEKQVEERLLDYLLPRGAVEPERFGLAAAAEEDARNRRERTRDKLREQLRDGQLEESMVEVSVEEKTSAVGVLGQAGMEMDVELQSMFEKMLPARRETRRLSVREARRVLFNQEAEKLVDRDRVHREAIERAEQAGIIFLDEIDKIAGTEARHGPDVSRQGVQRDLLPIVEGSTVVTKYGTVKTDHVLFIAAGAFHSSKPSDLMPELQGRFPIRVELSDLTKEDFVRVLKEPRNALTKQTVALLKTEGVEVNFGDDAVDAVAQIAWDVNRRTQNIGARRLYTILEKVFEAISFDAPDLPEKRVTITADYVRERLGEALKDEDLSRFIL